MDRPEWTCSPCSANNLIWRRRCRHCQKWRCQGVSLTARREASPVARCDAAAQTVDSSEWRALALPSVDAIAALPGIRPFRKYTMDAGVARVIQDPSFVISDLGYVRKSYFLRGTPRSRELVEPKVIVVWSEGHGAHYAWNLHTNVASWDPNTFDAVQ